MKMKFKRFLSGVMAVATLASVSVQPVAVSASELEPEEIPFEQQYPELKEVQDSLDPDEIVTANDIELAYGQEFEEEVDLFGIEGADESKTKILFYEAKNDDGADFDIHTPNTYKAVYAMEPVSEHPSYRISRNITVKESETDSNGKSSATIVKTHDTVYLKEITAPKGNVLNTTAYNVKLVANKTTSTTVPDKEQFGELTVYKEGHVLAGAEVSDSGVAFKYENRRLKGAVYNVYVGVDIMSAYGAKIYSKGDLVKEKLSTDENGACILKICILELMLSKKCRHRRTSKMQKKKKK